MQPFVLLTTKDEWRSEVAEVRRKCWCIVRSVGRFIIGGGDGGGGGGGGGGVWCLLDDWKEQRG